MLQVLGSRILKLWGLRAARLTGLLFSVLHQKGTLQFGKQGILEGSGVGFGG